MHFSKVLILLIGIAAAAPYPHDDDDDHRTSSIRAATSSHKTSSSVRPVTSSHKTSSSVRPVTSSHKTSSSVKAAAAVSSKAPSASPSKVVGNAEGTPSKIAAASPSKSSTHAAASPSKAASVSPSKAAAATPSKAASVSPSKAASVSPSKAASSASQVVAAGSTPSACSFSSTQAQSIITDLNAFDSATTSLTKAIQNFTIPDTYQGDQVTQTGQVWQNKVQQLLNDATNLHQSACHFSQADSDSITKLIANTISGHLVTLYDAVIAQKTQFVNSGEQAHVEQTLTATRDELHQICDNLTPLILSNDYGDLQTAGDKIYAEAQKAIAAYA